VTADDRYIISGSDDSTLKVWDIETGKLLHTLKGHSSSVTAVVLTENGRRVISSSHDKTIKLWDIESGKLIKRFVKMTV